MKCRRCGHEERSHRNRPYGRAVITTWCHVKGCNCKSFHEELKKGEEDD